MINIDIAKGKFLNLSDAKIKEGSLVGLPIRNSLHITHAYFRTRKLEICLTRGKRFCWKSQARKSMVFL